MVGWTGVIQGKVLWGSKEMENFLTNLASDCGQEPWKHFIYIWHMPTKLKVKSILKDTLYCEWVETSDEIWIQLYQKAKITSEESTKM